MFFKFNFARVVCVFCVALLLTVTAFADTIRLKDGSIIKGKIVGFNGGKFTVIIGDGTRQRQMTFSAGDIESIVFDNSSASVNTSNQASSNTTAKKEAPTIITAGQTSRPNNTTTAAPKVNTNQTTTTTTTTSNKTAKPIEINVRVLADNTANGWTNSGWVVRKGQRIKITGSGRISLGNGRYTTAGGIASLPDNDKLVSQSATGGLIAVIGDNNNDFIFIGESREFVATRDGALFLGINEGNLDDNSGAFEVKIEISPEIGF